VRKVNLIINGTKLTVPEDQSVLQAAQSMGIEIPHLCYDPRISPSGACRLCVVEVKGKENLMAACSLPVSEGMEVLTNSERVKKARKIILELILSDHPLDCLTCEKSGNCELEKYAYQLKVSSSRFLGERSIYPIREENPFISRDNSKCILCGRCVTVCEEVQGCSVLDFSRRGFATLISTGLDRSLTESPCVFCGNCVLVCPVEALTEKGRKFEGREWELKKVETVCPYCGCGCNIELNVKDNRIIKVTSSPESVVNQGWLCSKGKFGFEFVHSSDRLRFPLIKKEGKFYQAGWDEALTLISEKLPQIRRDFGPDSMAGLSSAKCTNEENYLFQKFMRAVIGTNNVDHCARLCHASTVAGLARSFGSGAMTNSIGEIKESDCILITGSNTSETHPIIALQVKAALRNNGARLIVADPRKTEMAELADVWLRHKPGTDVALFNGMMKAILKEGLLAEEFVAKRTEGFDEFARMVKKYTLSWVEEITGVSSPLIREAARIYAGSEKATILYAMGITQHISGTDNVLTLANLAMLCGKIGKRSCGVNPLRGQNNVQGACDLGALPDVYPGYQPVDDIAVRRKFEEAWSTSLSDKPGLTVMEMIQAIEKDEIKALYIMGENSALSDPNSSRTRAALAKVDFLVVQDIFFTETADFADVVLPAACFAEKEGTFTNTERRIQRVRQALSPPGEARADGEIICSLAEKMGQPMSYSSPGRIMEEVASLTPIYGGVSFPRLKKGGLQWPCPYPEHPGTKFLHRGRFSRGLGKFHSTRYGEPAELPDSEYPFILSTGRTLFHWHTGTMSRRVRGLNEIYPEALAEIHPEDAAGLGLKTGDMVEVSSRRGKVRAKAEITDKSPPGVVFMTFHFREAAANILTLDALDPIAKIPEFKVCAVKVKKVGESQSRKAGVTKC